MAHGQRSPSRAARQPCRRRPRRPTSTAQARRTVTLGSTPGPVVDHGHGRRIGDQSRRRSRTCGIDAPGGRQCCMSGQQPRNAGGRGVLDRPQRHRHLPERRHAGADYALVAFYGNPDSSQVAPLTVQSAGGVTAVTSASVVAVRSIRGASAQLAPIADEPRCRNRSTVASARDRATRADAEDAGGARVRSPARRQQGVILDHSVESGDRQLFTLNANGNNACDSADQRRGARRGRLEPRHRRCRHGEPGRRVHRRRVRVVRGDVRHADQPTRRRELRRSRPTSTATARRSSSSRRK